MKNRGQALVEFVIVLPILMLLILGAIDFGNILYKKYILENDLDYVVELVQKEDTVAMEAYLKKQGITSSIEEKNNQTSITVFKNISVITPGLNRILGNPYKIEANRVIANEK